MNDTGRLIADTGIIPKKSKGQNFLIDDRVADRHIGYAEIERSDKVLEVGPGLGILTKRLIEVSDDVTCIEIDDILADYITETYGDRLRLIHADAVKEPFPDFDVFVSNLPYSVSTPIIFKLLEYDFRTAVVMVQKEFADRMVAMVGSPDYSRLTVNLYYRSTCEIMETVPASRFNPRPKVDSALVRITPREPPFKVMDEGLFFKVVEVTFNHRRKKIGTSLKSAGLMRAGDDVPYIDDRVERLRPEQIGEIADAIHLLKSNGQRPSWSSGN
jgi:16S rRNA (adenine1518-N6/adenine1519-N6)-dimethyltransferase